MSQFVVRRVAVLGAGVMGAQIAAHCVNAGIPVVLFDMAAQDSPSGIASKAIAGLKKLAPAPLALAERSVYLEAANYDEDLGRLAECDLVIEAIAERLEWKQSLYQRIAPHIAPGTVFASNTSGLSINRLAAELPEALQPGFCGVHFFNPPRYMHLVELIPGERTEPALVDALESWLVTRLGKGVVRAKDTPNFVANRVGVFSFLAVMHHTARLGLSFDEVDALTGPRIGRPKSATFRTIDVVGLDTLANVIRNMQATLGDDPWCPHYVVPAWMEALIANGALGQKTQGGIYRKVGKDIEVLDAASGDYVAAQGRVADEVGKILDIADTNERLAALAQSAHPQARFLWSMYRDVFHYCARHLADIADNARDVDFAMRWGFGWSQGPFENWQAAGWKWVAEAIRADIESGEAMAAAPLPQWVFGLEGVHAPEGSYAAGDAAYRGRSALPVYRRQIFPEPVFGDGSARPEAAGETLWENAGVRLWRLPDRDPGVAIVSIKSKMHTLGHAVTAGLREAVARAERDFDALVIWGGAPFAVGANLEEVVQAASAGKFDELEQFVAEFQRMVLALKYAAVPVIAAVDGLALGGGCELALHCARRVATLESQFGLVEVGVGLIPAGGGCKELALRAAARASESPTVSPFDFVQPAFERISQARVCRNALEARDAAFLDAADVIVFNSHELLHVALTEARAMAQVGYQPPLPARAVPVCGRVGIATLRAGLVNMHGGGKISDHDLLVGTALATALCGGEVEGGSLVDESWQLRIERDCFLNLLKTDKTRERMVHMLETGRALRN